MCQRERGVGPHAEDVDARDLDAQEVAGADRGPGGADALPGGVGPGVGELAGDLEAEREPVLEVEAVDDAVGGPQGAGGGGGLARAGEVGVGEAGVADVEAGDDAGEAVAELLGLAQPGGRARAERGPVAEHDEGVHRHGPGDAALPGDAEAALAEAVDAGLDAGDGAAPAAAVEVGDAADDRGEADEQRVTCPLGQVMGALDAGLAAGGLARAADVDVEEGVVGEGAGDPAGLAVGEAAAQVLAGEGGGAQRVDEAEALGGGPAGLEAERVGGGERRGGRGEVDAAQGEAGAVEDEAELGPVRGLGEGEVLVAGERAQHGEAVEFAFNLPMVFPLRNSVAPGGVIDLKRTVLDIREPYLTIAGQTAPSPGITIVRGGIDVHGHDVVVRHLRVRTGVDGQAKLSGWEAGASQVCSAPLHTTTPSPHAVEHACCTSSTTPLQSLSRPS